MSSKDTQKGKNTQGGQKNSKSSENSKSTTQKTDVFASTAAKKPSGNKSRKNASKGPNKSKSNSTKQHSCAFCNANHQEENCKKYATAEERFSQLTNDEKCYYCFYSEHWARDCRNRPPVCSNCNVKHAKALCRFKYGDKSKNSKNQESSKSQFASCVLMNQVKVQASKKNRIKPPMLLFKIKFPSRQVHKMTSSA